MVEEVLIHMGMDHRPVTAALQGVRKDFSSFKSELKTFDIGSALKGGAAALGIGLSVTAITSAAKASIEYAHDLKQVSDAAGVSASTLQAWSMRVSKTGGDTESASKAIEKFSAKIGDARSGNKSSIEVFDSLGVSLSDMAGKAKSNDQILLDVMDRIKAIKDPTLQLAAACDVFGEKMGAKVVNALKAGGKAFEEFKANSSGKILSDADVARLDELSKKFRGLGSWFKTTVGKGVVGFSNFFMRDSDLSQMIRKQQEGSQGEGESYEKKAEKAKELASAMDRLNEARYKAKLSEMSESQKLNLMQEEVLSIEQEIRDAAGDDLEIAKLKTKLLERQKELNEQAEKVNKQSLEFDKKKTEEKEKQDKKLEHEREVVYGINKALYDRSQLQRDLESKLSDQTKFTLQDLAGLNIDQNTTGDMRQQIVTARQIQWWQGRARMLAEHGYEGDAQGILGKIDKVRSGMTALTEAERFPFKDMAESLAKAKEGIFELVRKAGAEGYKIDLTGQLD